MRTGGSFEARNLKEVGLPRHKINVETLVVGGTGCRIDLLSGRIEETRVNVSVVMQKFEQDRILARLDRDESEKINVG